MSEVAAAKLKLGLTTPEHDRKLRQIFDAISQVSPALAQVDLVQVEAIVRLYQLEQIEVAGRRIENLISNLKADMPNTAASAVRYQTAEMLRALRQTAADEIAKVGADIRRANVTGDPAEIARQFGRGAASVTLMLVFGIALGLALPDRLASLQAWLQLEYVIAAASGATFMKVVEKLVSGAAEVFYR